MAKKDTTPEEPDPRKEERLAWIEANPDASAIPPSLLPPRYQDGTQITPGLPD